MKYTREQLEAMPPRELDAVVAEVVMGVEPEIIWIGTTDGGKSACVSSDARRGPFYGKSCVERWVAEHPVVWGERVELGKWERYLPYSTDMAAAWPVAEYAQLSILNCGGRFVCGHRTHPTNGYVVVTDGYPMCDTAPRAVCIAAVLAVEAANG